MACDLKLQITNYNIDTRKKESLLTSIGTIEEDQKVDINQIAYIIFGRIANKRKNSKG